MTPTAAQVGAAFARYRQTLHTVLSPIVTGPRERYEHNSLIRLFLDQAAIEARPHYTSKPLGNDRVNGGASERPIEST